MCNDGISTDDTIFILFNNYCVCVSLFKNEVRYKWRGDSKIKKSDDINKSLKTVHTDRVLHVLRNSGWNRRLSDVNSLVDYEKFSGYLLLKHFLGLCVNHRRILLKYKLIN